jgi:lipopolysaccharide biosynthesis glycosyltransferase
MNLEAMRRDGSTRAVIDWALANRDKLDWPEQDALNVVLGDRRLPLHPRWNVMNSVLNYPWAVDAFGADALEEARRDPAIRHFEGPSINKPWHYLCERSMRELYFEHRRQTPWPRARLEGATPGNVVRRLVRGARRGPASA